MPLSARSTLATALAVFLVACTSGDPDLRVGPARAGEPVSGASQIVVAIDNTGTGDDELVAVETDAAVAVELHETTIDDGRARMEQRDTVELPAGETTEFRPGGLHLMMVAPDEAVTQGGTFEVTLSFDRSDPTTVSVEVVDVVDLAESTEADTEGDETDG
jgi:periplasmic copper chaperone A